MNPAPYNFIVARFGDNTYGHSIKEALIEGVNYWGLDKRACPIIWKQFIIAHLVGCDLKKRAIGTFYTVTEFGQNDYYQKLKVTLDINPPTEDHDGGSAAYDLHRKYAWTF